MFDKKRKVENEKYYNNMFHQLETRELNYYVICPECEELTKETDENGLCGECSGKTCPID